ncbi:MAG: hypothetical protein ACFFHV_15790 [Promethearchaeota archaeon]
MKDSLDIFSILNDDEEILWEEQPLINKKYILIFWSIAALSITLLLIIYVVQKNNYRAIFGSIILSVYIIIFLFEYRIDKQRKGKTTYFVTSYRLIKKDPEIMRLNFSELDCSFMNVHENFITLDLKGIRSFSIKKKGKLKTIIFFPKCDETNLYPIYLEDVRHYLDLIKILTRLIPLKLRFQNKILFSKEYEFINLYN